MVYCMSPDYLNDLVREFEGLHVVLQGYGNFKDCAEQLITVNKADLLGVVIVANQLDLKDPNCDLFFAKLNIIGPVRVVIAVNGDTQEPLQYFGKIKKKYNKLELYFLNDWLMSDYFIVHELIGTLLKDVPAYKDLLNKESGKASFLDTSGNVFKYLVSPDIIKCIADVKVRENAEDAVREDDVIPVILSDNIKELRAFYIHATLGNLTRAELTNVEEIVNEFRGSTNFVFINEIYNIIKGLVYSHEINR